MLRTIGIFFGTLLLLGFMLSIGFVYDAFFVQPETNASSIIFEVEQGDSVAQIASRLHESKIITSKIFFKLYVKLTGTHTNLQAGSFALIPGMNFRDLVAKLTNAQAQEVQMTIPEGYTAEQIGEAIVAVLPEISEEDWEEVSGEKGTWMISEKILSQIPRGQGLEGYLFPDTYRFRIDADARVVAQTLVSTLARRVSEQGIVIPENGVFENGLTVHELLTLASIVEREVQNVDDMKLVAGIFFTRLEIGMALQADSTVNYVTGKNTAAVSLDDSKIASPYNTYQHLGLPPGPISNPGMNAILAVLHPQESDYVYFLTIPEGEVIYASTFDEHRAHKDEYLR